jgi:hypothetical protein
MRLEFRALLAKAVRGCERKIAQARARGIAAIAVKLAGNDREKGAGLTQSCHIWA